MAPIEPNILLPIGPSPSIFGTTKGLLLLLPALRPTPGNVGREGRLFQRLSRNPPLPGAPKAGGGGGGGN